MAVVVRVETLITPLIPSPEPEVTFAATVFRYSGAGGFLVSTVRFYQCPRLGFLSLITQIVLSGSRIVLPDQEV